MILDEPTIGLDPKQIREIRNLIKGFSRNRTVILSTHILPEVSQICDRVIIINKGTIIAEDTPTNLIQSHGKLSRCELVVGAPEDEVRQMLSGFQAINSVRLTPVPENGRVSAFIEAASQPDLCPALARAVTEKGWDLFEMRPLHATLEDVFIDLVTEETEEVFPHRKPTERRWPDARILGSIQKRNVELFCFPYSLYDYSDLLTGFGIFLLGERVFYEHDQYAGCR